METPVSELRRSLHHVPHARVASDSQRINPHLNLRCSFNENRQSPMIAYRPSCSSAINEGRNCVGYLLAKPLVRRVIVFAAMPDEEKVQRIGLKWQWGYIEFT